MFFPKSIYETIPYLYLFTGAYLLAFYDAWEVYIPAGLFYLIGSIMLVKRSDYRRIDRLKSLKQTLPLPVYEYLPYLYLAISMTVLVKSHVPWLQFLAFCLMMIALRNMLFRMGNRHKMKSLF